MESSIGSAPSFHQYPLLPYELRLLIIQQFLLDYRRATTWPIICQQSRWRNFAPLSSYATVDMQWKSVVEKITFHSLSLMVGDINRDPNDIDNTNDLDGLETICTEDRMNFVSEICVSIFLVALRCQTESSTDTTIAISDHSSNAVENDGTISLKLHAESVATSVFGRLFGILKSWPRDRDPLALEYKFDEKRSRGFEGVIRWRPRQRWCTNLRIDTSGFPEVACIGSFQWYKMIDWTIQVQPASMFQLLARLPNATSVFIQFDEDLGSPAVAEMVAEGQSAPSFQRSKLKTLALRSMARYSHPSLQLSQSIFTMSSRLERLEELRLENVVDVQHFLRQSWCTNGRTQHSLPTWPNLRKLLIWGHFRQAPLNRAACAGIFYDSITHLLPQMPNINYFYVTMTSSSSDGFYGGNISWVSFSVGMTVPPRDDRSAMPDAKLHWFGVKPDQETIDTWKKIVRSQWYCGLVFER